MSKQFLWFLVVTSLAAAVVLVIPPVAAGQTPAAEPRAQVVVVQANAADAATPTTIDDVLFDEGASAEELLDSAREMFLADNYALAEMLYKSVLVRDPNHLDAMLELAIVYEAMGKLEYARGLLTRAALLKPNDPEISRRGNETAQKLGLSLENEIDDMLNTGKYELAIPKLSVLLTSMPENADLYYKRSQCHLALGHPESAIADVDRALDLRSDDRYFQLKTRAEAMQTRREINGLVLLAKKQIASGDPDTMGAAVKTVGHILELDPEHEWATGIWQDLTAADVDPEVATSAQIAEVWAKTRSMGTPVANVFTRFGELAGEHVWMLFTILAVLLIFNSPLTRVIIRGHTPKQLLVGKIERFSMSEILMLVHSHSGTGVMRVRGRIKGLVYFNEGEITHCKTAKLEGEKALQAVIQLQEGTFDFTESSIPVEKTIHAPLSLILMELPSRPASYSMQDQHPRVQSSRIKTLLNAKR